jgi:hypothetical protein
VIFEAHHPVRESEQGVVLGEPDVLAGLPFRAVLPEEDRSPLDLLAPETLDPQALRVAVAAVPARALPLLVRQGFS